MINKLLNIKYPLIQGGMANIADGKFAACVSNAGGMGIIAGGALNKEQILEEIRICKSLTDKPFGVNIMLMNPHAKDLIDACCEEGVKFVTTGAGSPGIYMEQLKKHNILVFPVVASVALAIRMERLGADGIIAEGTESGGHVGELTTMVLVPQVCDAVKIPVVAAGGIADNRGFKAALALGAQGVQIGTRLLASNECKIHQNYKDEVIKAKDLDTVVTGKNFGVPVRQIRNDMTREYLEREKNVKSKMELEDLVIGSLRKAVNEGDVKRGSLMAGQISGLVKEIKPVKEIIKEICGNDYE